MIMVKMSELLSYTASSEKKSKNIICIYIPSLYIPRVPRDKVKANLLWSRPQVPQPWSRGVLTQLYPDWTPSPCCMRKKPHSKGVHWGSGCMHVGVEGWDFKDDFFFFTSLSLFIFSTQLVTYSGMARPCVGLTEDILFVCSFLSLHYL